MKLKFKEDPKEWRKAAWLAALGLGIFSSLLRWRHILPARPWEVILCLLAAAALSAAIQPRLFRGFHRFSTRLSHGLTEIAGRIALAFIFIVIVTPLGWMMRMTGKDPLRLRRPPEIDSYWSKAPDKSPLDRLF
jgi:hypothetical protein